MMTGLKPLAVLVCGATFFLSLTLAAAQPYIYLSRGRVHSTSSSTRARF
jgi:hypothetical protein